MSNTRYLILAPSVGREVPDDAAMRARSLLPDGVSLKSGPLHLIARPASTVLELDGAGWIIGDLFARAGPLRPLTHLDNDEIAKIRATRGRALIGNYWGSYVALLHDDQGWMILRAPIGALPCYFRSASWGEVISAEAGLLAAMQPITAVNWRQIALDLYARDVLTGQTALAGVEDLLPGMAKCVDSGGTRHDQQWWTPWDFSTPRMAAMRPEELRRVVLNSTRALTSRFNHALLSLSGGLDSAIVAACLAGRGGGFSAVTLTTSDPMGDERDLARLTAKRTGAMLLELARRLEDIDLSRSVVGHLPRTGGWTHAQAFRAALDVAVAKSSADAIVTGQGGDNVFYNTRSARPVIDALLSRGPRTAARAVRNVAVLTDASWWAVIRAAVRTARRSGRGYRWSCDVALLTRDAREMCERAFSPHAWLEPRGDGLPGKAAQIAMVLRLQNSHEMFDRSTSVPILHPLAAQPVVEFCLAVPTWETVTEGQDRSVARQAFRRQLPGEILTRRSKGSPEGFALEFLESRRREIRERILDGRLAAQGIVDRAATEVALHSGQLRTGPHRLKLLAVLDTEAWLDQWLPA